VLCNDVTHARVAVWASAQPEGSGRTAESLRSSSLCSWSQSLRGELVKIHLSLRERERERERDPERHTHRERERHTERERLGFKLSGIKFQRK